MYELIDIIASPLLNRLEASWVSLKVGSIGEHFASNGIGVEVVVEVDGINIVPLYKVIDHLREVVNHLGKSGIEKELLAVAEKPLGVSVVGVLRG